jgi:MFS family permease
MPDPRRGDVTVLTRLRDGRILLTGGGSRQFRRLSEAGPKLAAVETAAAPPRTGPRRGVAPNVWFLGLTSLLTDTSSELVASVLPLYLVLHLGLSPLGFGLVDGLQHGVAALVRLASGLLSDRVRRYKPLAAAGYALSAACRLALLPAGGSLPALAAITAVDRIGKGTRTAPRDALLSLSARPEALGAAFGVHRSLDAAGALLGPIVAFALLARRPDGFADLFVVAFLVALAGLGALVLLVRDVRPAAPSASGPALGLAHLLEDPALRRLALAGAALGAATISDGFLYLALQRASGIPASSFPLLAVATSLVYLVLAAPCGRLADRIGRRTVFLAGYALLAPAYASAGLGGPGWLAPAVGVLLLGAHHAATDGVLMALTAALVAPAQRGGSLALVGSALGLARLGASLLFGFVWSRASLDGALLVFGVLLLVALAAAARAIRIPERSA